MDELQGKGKSLGPAPSKTALARRVLTQSSLHEPRKMGGGPKWAKYSGEMTSPGIMRQNLCRETIFSGLARKIPRWPLLLATLDLSQ